MGKRIGEDECFIDKNRIVRSNSLNKNASFIIWFYSTNMRYFRINIYKKEVEKLFVSKNRRDVGNQRRANGEIAATEDLITAESPATMENPVVVKDRNKKNVKKIGRLDPIVAKNPNWADVEGRDRNDIEESVRLGIIVENPVAKDLVVENLAVKDSIAQNSDRVNAENKNREDIKESARPSREVENLAAKDLGRVDIKTQGKKKGARLSTVAKNLAVKDLAIEDLVTVIEQRLARQMVTTFSFFFFQSVFFLFFSSSRSDICGCSIDFSF